MYGAIDSMKNNNLIINICDQISNKQLTHPVKSKIYDPFDIPSDDEEYIDKKFNRLKFIKNFDKVNTIICIDCGIEMDKSFNMTYECKQCGGIEDDFGNGVESISNNCDVISSYNTSDTSATPIRIAGPNNYMYQKKLVSNTSNYKKTQKKNTNDQIINFVYQYKGSTPPKNVVLEAADLYYTIQQHCIKRGEVRKGTMAACLYRTCIIHNITRKPKEIADIFGIPQSELSNGEKILDNLIASGLIKIKDSDDLPDYEADHKSDNLDDKQISAFLSRYFESLNIPDHVGLDRPNYKEFAMKLIKFTKKYRIAESSIMSSKCAGVVYILSIKRKELNIKRDMIEKECCISKSTFGRFSQAVFVMLNSDEDKYKKVRSRLRNLFKKYQIPL